MSSGRVPETRANYGVYEVFTPNTQAKANFVPRPVLENQIVDALRTPGRQVIVYGETGSGKSTLIERKLNEVYSGHITTRCHGSSTFEQIVLDAFDRLEPMYESGRTATRASSISLNLGADYRLIKAAIAADASRSTSATQARMLPPQLTPQRLGELLGATEQCWLIEDFHKVQPNVKLSMAQILKVFCDLASEYPHLKIVALGATDSARAVVEFDREMANRVAEVHVPLMDDHEIGAILTGGESLLNVSFESCKQAVVEYSVGVGSICHQLGLYMCTGSGVENTQDSVVELKQLALDLALERYLSDTSDTMKKTFETAIIRERERTYDNPRLILRALANGPNTGMSQKEILTAIQSESPASSEYPQGNLTNYLKRLTGEERGKIIRRDADGKYRFADPFHYLFPHLSLNQSQGRQLDPNAFTMPGSYQHLVRAFKHRQRQRGQLTLFEWDDSPQLFREG